MKRQLAMCGVAAGVVGVTPAQADTIHWYWEVEVNGVGVDTSRPVVVEQGDQVDIELWAGFDPYGGGYAYSVFALTSNDGLFESGVVSISESDGYGRNPALAQLGSPGTPVDVDGGPAPDVIDGIETYQPPRFFNSQGDWREPLPVYRIGWSLHASLEGTVPLVATATQDGTRLSHIYVDEFGVSREYEEIDHALRFVPAPATCVVLVLASAVPLASRRAGGR